MEFQSPWLLLLLLLLPLAAYVRVRRKTSASVRFSSLSILKDSTVSLRVRLRPVLAIMRFACLALLIIALARPRKGTELSSISTEGVAMEIVVDRSSSMLQEMVYEGQTLNRLEVSKLVLKDFVGGGKGLAGRTNDLVGLITFARYPDTICPLIHGHDVLLGFLAKTQTVRPRSNEDGTAIGDAIALGGARLKRAEEEVTRRNKKMQMAGMGEEGKKQDEFKIKSKVIVLLTDGQNNAGDYNPMEAAGLAKEWGIKIYTIGIDSANKRRDLFGHLMGSGVDEGLLKSMAEATGGFYAKAASGEDLLNIYKEIDKLEKTKVKSLQYTQYAERFDSWALAGLVLLGVEILGSCTVFRKVP